MGPWFLGNVMYGSGSSEPPPPSLLPFDPTSFAGFVGDRDPNDPAQRFKVSNGTDPATADGDLIAALGDSNGGAGPNWIQNTGANRPVLKLAIVNARDVLRFNGTSQFLQGATGYSFAGDFSIFTAFRMNALVDTQIMAGAAARQLRIADDGSNRLSAYAGGNDQATSTALATVTGNWLTVGWVRRSGMCHFFENGIARGSGLLDGTMNIRTLGASDGATALLAGDWGRSLFYSSGLDDATVAALMAGSQSMAGFKSIFGL